MFLGRGLALIGLILALSANQCRAEDEPEPIIDSDGLLDISGSLNHAPCMLEMSSAYQTVELNNVSRADLLKPGSCPARLLQRPSACISCWRSSPRRW